MKSRTLSLAATVAAAALGVGGSASLAARAGDVAGAASCTTSVKAKLKAGLRNGPKPGDRDTRIKVQLDIDDRAAGAWGATANGVPMTVASAGTAANRWRTQLVVFLPNRGGADAVAVSAGATGRSCSGAVVVA